MESPSMFSGSNEMDSQQIRFSSSSEINNVGVPPETLQKRRACSNGFPNQLLLETTQYAWAPVSTSSGFGGSNTMAAMTSSFNSVNVSSLGEQRPLLSRSLESLALITGPSTSNALFIMGTPMADALIAESLQHKDDSKVNYSFDYDSGMGYGSVVNSSATTTNESFSSVGESFLSTNLQTQLEELEALNRPNIDQYQHFDSAYKDIIDGMQQCQPFQKASINDFEMDEC